MAYPRISPADPGDVGVRALILAQLEYGRAASPPEDAHALEPEVFAGSGFTPSAPFADYVASENSVYMSLPIVQ